MTLRLLALTWDHAQSTTDADLQFDLRDPLAIHTPASGRAKPELLWILYAAFQRLRCPPGDLLTDRILLPLCLLPLQCYIASTSVTHILPVLQVASVVVLCIRFWSNGGRYLQKYYAVTKRTLSVSHEPVFCIKKIKKKHTHIISYFSQKWAWCSQ